MNFGFSELVLVFGIIVVLAFVAAMLARFGRGLTQRAATAPAAESPLTILQARYARGEISKQQFDEIKRDLI